MNKLILFNLIFFFVSTSLFSQTGTIPNLGNGSSGNPYQVSSLDNLYWIAESSDRWGYSYRQTANIDASASSTFDSGAGWTPIGNDVKFLGNYDGQGYTIDSLYINRPNTNNIGLFGHVGYDVDGVTIKDLKLTNITVIGGRGSGTLVGRVTGDINNLIENCSAVGGTVAGDGATGGLVGSHNSYVDNPGNRDHHPILSKSFADIDVSWSRKPGSGADKFGGLTGCNQKGQIQHCFARGSVTIDNDPAVTVTNSDGIVPARTGGLSGCILIRGYIIKSYSTGLVSSSGTVNKVGGLVGSGGTGGANGDTEVCFWDTQTSGQVTSSPASGCTGKTTSEMKIQSTFTDWDFTNMWANYAGYNDGYPYLQWQIFLWVGGTDTSWAATGNWKAGKIPGATGNSVVIMGGSTYFPVISDQRTINNLEIESTAFLTVGSEGDLATEGIIENSGTLTINANGRLTSEGSLVNSAGAGGFIIESDSTSGSGSVILNNDVAATVRRYVSGKEWHIVSPPVAGQLINDFLTNTGSGISKNTGGEYAMTHYNESRNGTSGGWDPYYTDATTGNLFPGKGYLTGRSASGILEFAGTLAGSAIEGVEITKVANGWNAIGNPFASAIGVTDAGTSENFLSVNSSQMDNSFGAIYIFDSKFEGGSYRIINNVPLGEPELIQDYLQPGQGFIVKSKSGGGSISFTMGMRKHISEVTAPFFSKSSTGLWSLLRLHVAGEQNIATTLIAFNGNMSRGLNPTYDAGHYGADPELSLYTRLAEDDEGVNFAIQALPDYGFEDLVIPLGVDFAVGGEVTFSATELNLPAGALAVLEDRLLGIFTDLAEENYTVILNENNSGTGRFFIATNNIVTHVDEDYMKVSPKKLNIYAHKRDIFIVGNVNRGSYADLHDMAGRKVKSIRLANRERNSFRVDDLNTGIYLIRISGQDGFTTARVFIN